MTQSKAITRYNKEDMGYGDGSYMCPNKEGEFVDYEDHIQKLQEQAKEIKKGMESYWENHGIEWSWSDWDKFWEKYTGKEEKDGN